jgi:ribonuclease HII
MMDMWEFEHKYAALGYKNICGVDEAGRGPLAGPVCAAAVILPPDIDIPGLNDSKKLTDKKRRELFPVICEKAIAYGIAFADHAEIDEINILQSTYLAMERAIMQLKIQPDFALIDGNVNRDFPLPSKAVIHGDAISPSIAAASILAKVTRDRLCYELDREYPIYGIAKHKGYGSKAHMDALRQYGPSKIHRTKFIRFLDEEKK